ncbi:hypothetical protein K469DRAFT_712314 [Zopfia rhizophila CBS 207.26]|uniref:C2H2-type domain-containing protein n=1 Tax=Zopfia rhizophila CBS 207.26 TaxID=1314779 RepID=A0A6A6ER74_9PEZI|nr:hypothetical protein K469DRAFT_712314 [Zopfia rhizophila CBS 207.26]
MSIGEKRLREEEGEVLQPTKEARVDTGPYFCHRCGREFRRTLELRKHQEAYPDPYVCRQCNKEFCRQDDLKKHEKAHSQSYVCPDCNKTFERPCDLRKHEKTHTRPWKCSEPTCKYFELGWPTEKERDRHFNDKHLATAELHKCHYTYCTFSSKRVSNLKLHMEKQHGWEYNRTKTNGSWGRASKRTQQPQEDDRESQSIRELTQSGAQYESDRSISEDGEARSFAFRTARPTAYHSPYPTSTSWTSANPANSDRKTNSPDPPIPAEPIDEMAQLQEDDTDTPSPQRNPNDTHPEADGTTPEGLEMRSGDPRIPETDTTHLPRASLWTAVNRPGPDRNALTNELSSTATTSKTTSTEMTSVKQDPSSVKEETTFREQTPQETPSQETASEKTTPIKIESEASTSETAPTGSIWKYYPEGKFGQMLAPAPSSTNPT